MGKIHLSEIKENISKKLWKHIGAVIFLPGCCLLLYIWSTQGEPIFESWRKIGLFTTILPLCFTLLSWILGIISYRKKEFGKQIQYIILSYICCGIATWMFLLDIDLKMRNHDISSLRDLAAYYSCVTLIMWMITVWISMHTYKNIGTDNEIKKTRYRE